MKTKVLGKKSIRMFRQRKANYDVENVKHASVLSGDKSLGHTIVGGVLI